MSGRRREGWLDALRFVAAFLVIVNHTNSHVFQAATPQQATWWLSVVWYYVSKLAVPVFVLVSGACLLDRQDSLRRTLGRFGRMLAALLVFSYAYYLYDAWVFWGLWPRMANIGAFLQLVWTQQITDGFWYLYFYMGRMRMLPRLQRLCSARGEREQLYLMGLCFGLGAAWPLAAHYVPVLALPQHFHVPLFTSYIGLFFAGRWVREHFVPTRARLLGAAAALVLSIAASVALTRIEFDRVAPGAKYWFMDERMQPSLFTIIASIAVMMLAKGLVKECRCWAQLGGCAFGIYLVQDLLIAETKERLFVPLCGMMNDFAAVLLWEALVFAVALGAAWTMKRIPLIKKIV